RQISSSSSGTRPSMPSRNFRSFDASWFSISYPDDWQVYGQESSTVTILPPEGITQTGQDSFPAIAYGALVSIYEPTAQSGRQPSFSDATNQLLRELQRSNPSLHVTQQPRSMSTSSGRQALSTMASGDSPLAGETEVDWIVTTYHPDGLWYIVFIAPQS